jgi:hypothetical protein
VRPKELVGAVDQMQAHGPNTKLAHPENVRFL